ncbi:MAG: glycosyltransferase [Polyangiaceae bacterium]
MSVPAGKKLIFASSGSQVQDYESRAKAFFNALIAMANTQEMDKYHLVLAVGEKVLAELNVDYGIDVKKSTLPENVTLASWVSQLDVLNEASTAAVFTHGGLATVKESIWSRVPIVIVPHGKDQLDNSLRIERNGLGVTVQQEGVTAENFRKVLTQVTASTWIRRNLEKMRGVFEVLETTKPSVGIINTKLSSGV